MSVRKMRNSDSSSRQPINLVRSSGDASSGAAKTAIRRLISATPVRQASSDSENSDATVSGSFRRRGVIAPVPGTCAATVGSAVTSGSGTAVAVGVGVAVGLGVAVGSGVGEGLPVAAGASVACEKVASAGASVGSPSPTCQEYH